MKESPNLTTCTPEELADWLLKEVKANCGVVMFPMNNILTAKQLDTLTKAYRIAGQREGYKKGKKDGSGSTFNHFFKAQVPCQICRFSKICSSAHQTNCDIWLRWIGVK